MNTVQTFLIAVRALWRNRTRSFLTALGVIIGVASVISMVAIGEGAKAATAKVFEKMGTSLLVVMSGSTRSGGFMGGQGSLPTLTWDDLEAIRKEAPSVRYAAPLLNSRTSIVGEDGNWSTMVGGTTPEYFLIRNWKTERGAMFSDADVDSGAKVLVMGQTVAAKIFGTGVDPIGKNVRIRSTPFTVLGLLESKGQSFMGQDLDDAVYMPVSAFRTKLQGGLQQFVGGPIYVGATNAEETYRAQSQITMLLLDRHHIGEGEDVDFNVRNLTEMMSAQQASTKTLSALLAAIAIVSLLVGGIGIMNIMLVSVTERTREIGLRIAVGARPKDVLGQFLTEAVVLSAVGGILGVLVGTGLSKILADELAWPFTFRFDIVMIAVVFSGVVGVAFGLYPARKAARLDPIEALRYE